MARNVFFIEQKGKILKNIHMNQAIICSFTLLAILLIGSDAKSAELKPFETDYCTLFPEGPPSKPGAWKDCCLKHDLVYWAGGIKSQQKLADIELRKCVEQKSSKFYGSMMYHGVRFGHYSPIKAKTRWGHGWSDKRKFKALSSKEKLIVRDLLNQSNINPLYIENYIFLYIDD